MTSGEVQMTHWAGTHGLDYPVKAGQVWKVGRHTLVCSDLMASHLFDEVLNSAYPRPTLLYCDPPWGNSLVNSFRTKAGLGKATYTWQDLYRRIALLGHDRHLPVWLEGSKMESPVGKVIPSTMSIPKGFRGYWPILYASDAPAGLYYAGNLPYPEHLRERLMRRHDRDTPRLVMGAYPVGVVVEPCCGLGGTPLNAEKAGWGSLNNEINPYRMSTALHSLAKATKAEPQLLEWI